MTPLFQNEEWWNKFKEELISWENTPYRHLCAVKGRGADCTLLIAKTLQDVGILKEINFDIYPSNWYLQTNDEFVLKSFRKHIHGNFNKDFFAEEIYNLDDFMRGDILIFSTERKRNPKAISNHSSVWMDDGRKMFNAITDQGVLYTTYGSFWRRCYTLTFRIMER